MGIIKKETNVTPTFSEKPTPEEVKAARINAGLTQVQAAARFGYSLRNWQAKEDAGSNGRSLSIGEYELLLLMGNSHPTLVATHRVVTKLTNK
ncbi:hypothetical protein CYR55_22560 [Chimaeribacter californicus]|uniref:Uncharacterized protein n=1 Tax=Chimaeribacter californicus TaxID=2060067 RepID=A0A2N5DTK2_9GAMM|nr:hypothetical protein [Chimaeribacter californicus]PLR29875.1 hypothetical protein CYR55_22560 [Chimaeribacter californicus]